MKQNMKKWIKQLLIVQFTLMATIAHANESIMEEPIVDALAVMNKSLTSPIGFTYCSIPRGVAQPYITGNRIVFDNDYLMGALKGIISPNKGESFQPLNSEFEGFYQVNVTLLASSTEIKKNSGSFGFAINGVPFGPTVLVTSPSTLSDVPLSFTLQAIVPLRETDRLSVVMFNGGIVTLGDAKYPQDSGAVITMIKIADL